MRDHIPGPIRSPENAKEGIWEVDLFQFPREYYNQNLQTYHSPNLQRAFFYYDWKFEFAERGSFNFGKDGVQITSALPKTLKIFRDRLQKALDTAAFPDDNMAFHERSTEVNALKCPKNCSAACLHSLYTDDMNSAYGQFFMGNVHYQIESLADGLLKMGLNDTFGTLSDLLQYEGRELNTMGNTSDRAVTNPPREIPREWAGLEYTDLYQKAVELRNQRAEAVRDQIVRPVLAIIDALSG